MALIPQLRLWLPAYPGAKLFCYAAGTTTKQDTFTTSAMNVANANPVVADASTGLFPAIYLTPGLSYKFVLSPSTDTDPPTNALFTQDNVTQAATQALSVLLYAGDHGIVVTAGDDILVLADATLGAFTLTPYTAVGNAGRKITVLKIDTTVNGVTFDPVGSQTVGGLPTWIQRTPGLSVTYVSDGSNWLVVHKVGLNYVAKTALYTVRLDDDTVEWTSGTVTGSLPTAVGCGGKVFNLKNSGTGVITVDPAGAETIDGAATIDLVQYDSLTIMSNNANWIIL